MVMLNRNRVSESDPPETLPLPVALVGFVLILGLSGVLAGLTGWVAWRTFLFLESLVK